MNPPPCNEGADVLGVLFPNPEDLGIHYTSLVDAYLSYVASNREQALELSDEQWKQLRKTLGNCVLVQNGSDERPTVA
jgi:hypothetical protein